MNADGLIIPDRQCKIKNCPKSVFYIYWSSPSIDGSFKLIVSKKQIILTTGHENPNPDEFYWFVGITEHQYQTIVHKIDNSKGLFDEQDIPSFHRQLEYKKFVHERKDSNEKDFANKKYLNTKRLIYFFNSGVNATDRIVFPDQEKFESNKPIMSAGIASEITDFIIKY